MRFNKISLTAFMIAVAFCTASTVMAQVTAPSIFTTAITVQGEALGTEFDDWATSGIPVAFADPLDNPGDLDGRPFMDFGSVQVANDNDFLYLHMTYHNTSSVNTFIGIDTDQDTATGFDLFGLGFVGSEIGYQNDFVFQQHASSYNLNVSLSGGPLLNGGALIYPFFDQDGADKEWAIPLDLALGFPLGDPGFPNASIDILFYTEEGAGDITDVISYTLATAPVIVGDYNSNGIVDAADYTLYRDTFGDIGAELAADGDNSGEVDAPDYGVWANNFGSTSSTATAVPEPAAIVSLLTAIALASARRRFV